MEQPVAVTTVRFRTDHLLHLAFAFRRSVLKEAGFLLMSKMSTSDLKAMLAAEKTDALAAISAARHG